MTRTEAMPISVRSLDLGVGSSVPDLLERLRSAEPAALGEAYDAHHAAVRAFARRLVGDEASAEDLVHDVFVTLPKAVRRFRGDSSLRTFLISIAVNHSRHHLRAAARRRAAMERLGSEPVVQPGADPDGSARRHAIARALTHALDQLPLDQRVAFVLCEVEGHTSVEASKIVGKNENTIRTRVFHAKKKLRALLAEEVGR